MEYATQSVGCKSGKSKQDGVILRRQFSDVDEVAEFVNFSTNRNVRLAQVSLQQFQADLLMLVFDSAQFNFSKSTSMVRCLGEKDPSYQTFSWALATEGPRLTAHGIQVCPDTVFGFDMSREIDIVIPPGLTFCDFRLKQSVLADYLQIMERSDLNAKFLATNFLYAPIALPPVRSYLQQLQHLVERRPQFLKLSHLETLVLEDFVPLLIDAIPVASPAFQPPLFHHAKLVKQAEDYLMTRLDQPLTLKDLCKALNISRSPLFYGFQEMFGVGPMAYLKVQRLQAVRRRLKAADPETDSVMAIAEQFGFWSAGHFARDYKQMFGELPSETFKR